MTYDESQVFSKGKMLRYEESTDKDRAIRLLYEYWSCFSDKEKFGFKQIEQADLMSHIIKKINPKDLAKLEEWENQKLEQWKKEGRLTPEGVLLVDKTGEEFLRDN